MTAAEDEELANVFRAESAAIVEELGHALLAIEREGRGGAAQEEAYRLFHTLKGMCNMAGLADVGRLCHDAESALAPGKDPPVDLLLRQLDAIARGLTVESGTATAAADARGVEAGSEASFVSVDVRRLDNLLNLVGELAVAETRLRYEHRAEASAITDEAVSRLSYLVRALQEEVMTARLLPVRSLFTRLPRLARDAAKANGKLVRLETDDGNMEVDRSLVDRLTGVLAHLIQNAVVHGIERPEERARVGKPEEGLVVVRSRRENETLIVEVEDDGRGIDFEEVRARAAARGLVSAEEAPGLSHAALTDILLQPGFTTAAAASQHAGRGVGLTAAHEAILAIGGALALESKLGEGLRVVLRLPPTVAVLDTLLARANGSMVALPLRNVRRILPATATTTIGGTPSLVHDGAPVPVFDVEGSPAALDTDGFVIVAQAADGTFGVTVDEVIGTHSSILKPLDATLTERRSALGATVLGSGTLALILDPDSFRG